MSRYLIRSFALEGEDLILSRVFAGQSHGVYVDVGACHPLQYSNTQLLYERGWRGINIDPTPGSMAAFREHRPEDVNLEIAISSSGELADLFVFEQPALNSLELSISHDRASRGHAIVDNVAVTVRTLVDVLTEHLADPATEIDLLNIDVEGSERAVLHSNDWRRFRPRYIAIECSAFGARSCYSIADMMSLPITKDLITYGYEPFAKTFDTALFRRT